MSKNIFFIVLLLGAINSQLQAQSSGTAEDSLNAGGAAKQKTFIGGYGDASYQRDFNEQVSTVNLNRVVLFVGHRFNDKISFFSELELEDAKIEGGKGGGELALEQAYIKFNLTKNHYVTAGLFIPRIGLINENHLPGNYNGVERPAVERYVIPATWRELGIGFYGNVLRFPVTYSIAVSNGLDASGFSNGSGIRGGRFGGSNATANNLAVTAALQYFPGRFRFQVSGYAGGTIGLSPRQADSLKLKSGIFGTPVILGEGSIQYMNAGFAFKALGSVVSINDAGDINRAFANNTPELIYGAYGEVAYNLLETFAKLDRHKLWIFARYEKLNLNSEIPENGIINGTLDQNHFIAGFSYFPVLNVVIKADVRFTNTGNENPVLVINPSPNALPYERASSFLNVGIGYSF